MHATVIDTLRYANRLKDAGVSASQAEAMALAINDELVFGLATKADVENATVALKADMDKAVRTLRSDMDTLRSDMDTLRSDMDTLRLDMDKAVVTLRSDMERTAADTRSYVDQATTELRAELAVVKAKVETQGRYTFLVLAVIAALGLYNAVAPHFTPPRTATVLPAGPSPPATDSVPRDPGSAQSAAQG